MKIVAVAVCSLDGKITEGADPDIYKWTSREDQEFFSNLKASSKLIVMGSGTYDTIRPIQSHKEGTLRVVLTRSPEKYKGEEISEKLEFSTETPKELVTRLSSKYEEMLLAGGAEIFASFIKSKLIDEIYLTIEPVILGEGKSLFADQAFEAHLKLVSSEKINERGTLLLKYKVSK